VSTHRARAGEYRYKSLRTRVTSMNRNTPIPELVAPVIIVGLAIVLYGAHLETQGIHPLSEILQFGGMVVTSLPVLGLAWYLYSLDEPEGATGGH